MAKTTYTKITYANGVCEWGAFVDCGYGKTAKPHPEPGDVVEVTTKAGEVHQRTIRRIVKVYASGVKVVFVEDKAIAAKAQERYAEKIKSVNATKTREQLAKEFDETYNEGGEGYNPYR